MKKSTKTKRTRRREEGEWTDAMFKKAKSFSDLPKDLQKGLLSLKKRGRPKTAAPKRRQSFKLSQDVVSRIRNSGPGYNVRVDAALRQALDEGRI